MSSKPRKPGYNSRGKEIEFQHEMNVKPEEHYVHGG